MSQETDSIHQGLTTPRAAAIAGILFSLLLTAGMLLIKTSIPADPLMGAADVIKHSKRISLALDLFPFAGISFLWFVGVLRDRFGKLEDRFFATVFLGSALLFLAMMFTWASLAGGIIQFLVGGSGNRMEGGPYGLGRMQMYQLIHTYATKMAGVFMISTSTISLRTRIFPRWMAYLGFALALLLLLIIGRSDLILVVFPFWVLSISIYILFDNFRGAAEIAPARSSADS